MAECVTKKQDKDGCQKFNDESNFPRLLKIFRLSILHFSGFYIILFVS